MKKILFATAILVAAPVFAQMATTTTNNNGAISINPPITTNSGATVQVGNPGMYRAGTMGAANANVAGNVTGNTTAPTCVPGAKLANGMTCPAKPPAAAPLAPVAPVPQMRSDMNSGLASDRQMILKH